MVAINNLWVPPLQDRERDQRYWFCTPPLMFNTRVGENAAVAMGELDQRRLLGQRAWLWLDDNWLRAIVESSGTEWSRTALLAHEYGHVYLGHVVGWGAPNTWDREYEADVFVGRTLARLGASLDEAQSMYYMVAEETRAEDYSSHPSLSYRLAAVEHGYRIEAGIETTKSANDGPVTILNSTPYDLLVRVEGVQYSLARQSVRRIAISNDTALLALWECSPAGWVWTQFAIAGGLKLRIYTTGVGGDLAAIAYR
jgi:hypothetical protein